MRINIKALFVALSFGLAIGVLSSTYLHTLIFTGLHLSTITTGFLISLIGLLSFIISPVLLFVTFYFMGKKINTNQDFGWYLLTFFIGNMIGHFFGSIMMFVLALQILPDLGALLGVETAVSLIISILPSSLFVGLSALAIGYVFKNKQATAAMPEDHGNVGITAGN